MYKQTDFDNYAVKHTGIGSNILHDYQNFQSVGGGFESSVTPSIDSPGGTVKAGLSMVDVMDYVRGKGTEIQTINTGMAASMGSVLLGAGSKGMRSSLRFSRTMLHQSSGGAGGNIQDARITMKEWEKINTILFELLGGYCGKSPKQVAEDASRDLWLNSKEALDYGIIDEIL